MKNKLLQSLLQAGLLDIGDSDERLSNIEKSITDVETKLKKEQSLLPGYTLVALDPNINPDEPVLAEIEAIIAAHWKALRAKFSETPVPIIRAVLLHAMYNVGIADPKIARIIYLTASNYYPYAKLGREREIVEKILSDLGEQSEKNAAEGWSLEGEEPKLKLATLKISGLEFGEIEIDSTKLKNGLHAAIKNDPSGHSIQHGATSAWGTHFATQASSVIQNAITEGLGQIGEAISPSSIEDPINKFFADFKKSLDQVLKTSFNSIQAVERRSKLLWWKETLYSSFLKSSYRDVKEIVQPIIMALDLYYQLPDIVPVSVDYLLRDTLLLLNSKASENAKFADILKELSKRENIAIVKGCFEESDVSNKRISVTDFITLFCHGKLEASMFKQYTGIEDTEKVSLTDIAVMILHDMMAEHLIPKSK